MYYIQRPTRNYLLVFDKFVLECFKSECTIFHAQKH